MSSHATRRWSGHLPTLVTIVVGALVSIALLLVLLRAGEERRRTELRDLARERVEVLRTQVLRSMEVLHGIAALFEARGEVTRTEFRRFVAPALSRQPELQGLAWDARVPSGERLAFEQRARSDGFPDVRVTDENPTGAALPSPSREEYFPVSYVEPLERNAGALMFDVASEKHRRDALQTARDSGAVTATAPVRLAQEKESQVGFLVFEPLFRGRPKDLTERRSVLSGFAVAVFRVGDLVEASLRGARLNGAELRLVDNTTGTPLYGPPPHTGAAALSVAEPVEVADRLWSLTLTAPANWSRHAWPAWAAFAAGLAMTGILASHLWSNQRAAFHLAQANGALHEEVTVRQQAEKVADSANRAKSEFLANMSHEIRTPLNAILGYTQILGRNSELHPFQRDALATIARSGDHLLHLVNEVLDLSKIDAGRMELSVAEFDLARLLRDVRSMFQQPCEEKMLGLRFEGLALESPVPVKGDAGKLRQVLINLLGNAVKFTDAGRVTVRVVEGAEPQWSFSVEDTGIGIPPELQPSIFRPFNRGPGALEHGGTGLGLTIARRHVELMSGVLRVESRPGEGARFYFSLPLPAVQSRAESHRAGTREVERLADGCEVRALVIDDIPDNREVLASMLSAIGCEVLVAGTGAEAVATCERETPHIAFVDLRLPNEDGAEVIGRLSQGPAIKLVATSAAALSDESERCLKAGADDFVAKPFRTDRIYGCLKHLLGAEFIYRAAPAVAPSHSLLDFNSIALPEDLVTRLMMAAELHSATVLKTCLAEMEAMGEAEGRLAQHLRGFLASYDMSTIQRLIAQISVERSMEDVAP